MLTLSANILVTAMALLFALTCLFMMLVILIQKPKGGGLSGAFGGAGGSAQAAFGAKTGDLLTTITIGCFIVFLGLAIGLTYAIRADVTPKAATANPPAAATPATGTSDTGTTPVDDAAEPVVEDAAPADAQPQLPQPPAEEAPSEAPAELPADAPATDTQP